MSVKITLIECALVVVFLSPAAPAQTPAPVTGGEPLAFEVAVIKPSLPMAEALPLLMAGKLKVGVRVDKARVDMGFVTVTDLIVAAYEVKPHQISGPDWLSMERFDIQAKLPDGAVESQVPQMLRTLLADRFGLRTHTESRERSAYALAIGKNGAKLQPSTLPPDPEPAKGLNTLTPSAGGTVTSSGGPAGPTQMTMGPNGVQMVMLKAKISALADMLASILGKPVVDRTGLTGYYQIALDIPQEDVQNVARALGMGGPAGAGLAAGAPTDPGGSSMFQAVEKFGLRLDSRNERIETLIIDHIEKLPTAN
jgi:uncharacterized protein (TIGR03435 family)